MTFEVLEDQKVVAEITQKVHVHALCDKLEHQPENIQTFEKAISESDFRKVPIAALVNLYAFADGLERPQLKQQVVAALMRRVDELVAESQPAEGGPERSSGLDRAGRWPEPTQLRWGRFCFELGRHLRSAPVQQYEQALTLFANLREKSTEDRWVQQQAMVCQAELLLQCFGKVQEAIEILNQLEKNRDLDKEIACQLGIVWAEVLIAVGQADKAREKLGLATPESSEQSNKTSEEVKHMGMLRHARLLAQAKDDPVQLDYAMENIETILAEDPAKVLMPSLNLVRLDVHLARQEYLIAFHLAERLNKLELSNYHRLEVLVRQVRALCGIKAVEQAKVIYEAIAKDYPYSPVVAEAKKAIVEVVMAGQEK